MHDRDITLLIWTMRVVPDQRLKFDTDPFFHNLASNSEVKYTSLPHAPEMERRTRFVNDCREGSIPVAVVPCGFNLELKGRFRSSPTVQSQSRPSTSSFIEMDNDSTQVRISSSMIVNGVCIRWKGTIDRQSLKGRGRIEFDEHRAQEEAENLRNDMHLLEELNRQLEQHLHQVVTSTQGTLSSTLSVQVTSP